MCLPEIAFFKLDKHTVLFAHTGVPVVLCISSAHWINYTKLIILAGSEHFFSQLEQMLYALIVIDFGMMVAQVWVDTTSNLTFLWCL